MSDLDPPSPSPLAAFVGYFLWLGSFGFGGPIALAEHMQRDLVEQRRWIAKADYDQGLALAQLAPGPLAAQLAVYLGWVRARFLGATLVGIAFIAPSFVMVLALAAAYVRYGGLAWIQGAFYGIGAAVIAIVARGAYGLSKRTLGRDWLLWSIAGLNALVTLAVERELVSVVFAGGLFVMVLRGSSRAAPLSAIALPSWLVTGAHGAAGLATLGAVLRYFSGAGLVVFGSGLAIVPYLYGGVVVEHHWLSEREFLDAVAVAMITPGPVVITAAFIGYLVAGFGGALMAAIGVFLPCFLVVVIAAPHYRRWAANRRFKAFVDGVTSGAIGAIGGAVVVLARRSLVDAFTLVIAGTALLALSGKKKLPEPLLIALAALAGIAGHAWRARSGGAS